MDDAALLHAYAREHDQAAFAALVRRHIDLVHSAALRRTGGDERKAQDVTQQVFIDLARKAGSLARHPALPAWLHQSTRFAAANLHREEQRRRVRETSAALETETLFAPADSTADWTQLAPVLDAALDTLGETDRQTVLLRYFAQKPFADIAAALGTTEAAAQMRATRALEKLRRALVARGVTSTATALGLALGANAVSAAPASVATATLAGLAAWSSATAAPAATVTQLFAFLLLAMKLRPLAILLLLLLLVGGAGFALRSLARREIPAATLPGVSRAAPERLEPTPDMSTAEPAVVRPHVPFESAGDYQTWALSVLHAVTPDEAFALLHEKGLRLSRAAFDRAYAKVRSEIADGGGRNLEGNALFFIADFAQAWLREDYLAAARWMLDDTPLHDTRWTLFWRLANEWRRQPGVREALLERFSAHPNFPDLRALSLEETDPAAALAYVRIAPLLSLQSGQIVNGAFAKLFKQDPAAATAWALDPANAEFRRTTLLALGRDKSEASLAAAAAILETLEGGERSHALRDCATQMSFVDPATAARLMAEAPGFMRDPDNLGMFAQTLRLFAGQDPAAAARFAATRDLPPSSLAELGSGWAGRDAAAARARADGLQGEAREAAWRGVTKPTCPLLVSRASRAPAHLPKPAPHRRAPARPGKASRARRRFRGGRASWSCQQRGAPLPKVSGLPKNSACARSRSGLLRGRPGTQGVFGSVISIRRFFPTPVRDCSAIGLRWGC